MKLTLAMGILQSTEKFTYNDDDVFISERDRFHLEKVNKWSPEEVDKQNRVPSLIMILQNSI